MLTRLAAETKLQPSASKRLHRRFERIINVNGHPSSGDDVALFIDWENFKISLASGNRTPNVTALKEEVANHGRVVVAKAYADWVTRSPELKGASQFINDPPALYAAGIEPVYVPTRLPLGSAAALNSRTMRVKNSVDVKMTADCIECAHSYPNIGTYVLVSGDSDFIHVVNSLRAIGKQVIIIGVSWSTSRRLADQVDGLILYDADVDPELVPEKAPVVSSRSPSRTGGTNRQQLSDVMRVIEEIVRAERQAGRTPLLTSLKQRIMRRVSGFDEKKLGFSGFKKLMIRTAEEGNIKLVTVGLVDWVIMADEPVPVEALPESQVSESAIESVAADEEVVPTEDTVAEDKGDSGAPESTEDSSPTAEETTEGVPAAEVAVTPAQSDSSSEATLEVTEASTEARESDDEQQPSPALNPELDRVLEEILAEVELPKGPGDGQDGRRITDLIIMADTLEHQEAISHVAFNFLLGEICGALQQGLEAEHPEIAGRWGGRIYSRTYVTRLLRCLGEKDVFVRDWHQQRDEETGRSRRFRTFNLNRAHPLVREAVVSQWGPQPDSGVPDNGAQASDVSASVAEEQDMQSSALPEVAEPQVEAAEIQETREAETETSPQVGGALATEIDSPEAATVAEVQESEESSQETPEGTPEAPPQGTTEEPTAEATPKRRTRRAPTNRRRQSAKQPVPAADN